jgi:hypothetical protein
MKEMESKMMSVIFQSWTIEGCCSAMMTTQESPSMVKFWSFKFEARDDARWAARALLKFRSQGGLI